MLKKSYLVLLIIFLIAGLCSSVHAPPSEEVVAVYGTTPTVNGEIAAGEWDADSSIVTFKVDNDYDCTAYVKQDGSNLYIACDIPDPTIETDLGSDRIWIFLDVEHNGGTDPQTDDIGFRIDRDGTPSELNGTGTVFQYTVMADWSGGASSTSAGYQVEYNIPYLKIGVTAGQAKTLGINLAIYDDNDGTPKRGWWPSGSSNLNPDTWADLIFHASATIESCDVNGAEKDVFNIVDGLYAKGSGFEPSSQVDIYAVGDIPTYSNGMALGPHLIAGWLDVPTDANGDIIPHIVWTPTLVPGLYDLVVDANGNQVYDEGIDAVDNNDIIVTAGFFVVPEIWLGTIMGLLAMFMAFAVFYIQKRQK